MAASDGLAPALGLQLDPHYISQNGPPPQEASEASTSSSLLNEDGTRRTKIIQGRPKANSSSSRPSTTSTSTSVENRATPRIVRTLPPWIDSYEEGEQSLNSKPTDRLLSSIPPAHRAQHHYAPASTLPPRKASLDGYIDVYDGPSQNPNEKRPELGFFGGHKEPVRGRKWDHARESEPVIMQSNGQLSPVINSPWRDFIKASAYGSPKVEDQTVNPEFERILQVQTPGYDRPWCGDLDGADDPEKLAGLFYSKRQRKTFIQRWQNTLLMHPLVPLIFRMIVLTTSIIALSLSASIHKLSDTYSYSQNASTTMAIVVDIVAIPYILWITWDEYTGKPLGLRSPKAKIRLVLLDQLFIIFESANISLAFAALTDSEGSCKAGQNGSNDIICGRVKALCAFLMVAIIAWSLTFSVSIFRLVERVGGREEAD